MQTQFAIQKTAESTPGRDTTTSRQTRDFRVALACTGIGHVNRGYEASVTELYQAVKGEIDVQLYRGNGLGLGSRCLSTVGRCSTLYRFWPFRRVSEYSKYRNENLSFAVHFAILLFFKPADIIFTPDHILATLLKRVRRFLPRRPTVVFSNGAPFENAFCETFEAVHQKSYDHFSQSEGHELQDRSWLIANGFDPIRLKQPSDFSRDETLRRFNIDPRTTVVLTLAAHNRSHKRIDWLLSEFSRLDQTRFTLVVAGQPTSDSESLKEQAQTLGCNVRFVTVPQQDVPELIWASDIMTLCSLSEGFPRSIAESMGGQRHIFVHPHKNARWIIGDNEYCYVDMQQESKLAAAIQHAVNHPDLVTQSAACNHKRFLDNFTWTNVAKSYVVLFEELATRRSIQTLSTTS